jgi:metal-sulfur cluster biosynthetic enzyme
MDTAIRERLTEVYDPELGVNIIDLGLVYDVEFQEGNVLIRMTLTTPGCPMHDTLVGGVERALKTLPSVQSVKVDVVWEPAWSPERMSADAKEHLGYI